MYSGPTLREIIDAARRDHIAVGHFNISNLEALWGIFKAAQSISVPVIIGVSEGERDFIGVNQVSALVRSLRDEFNFPIFLNADHSYSFETVKAAVDAGFDAVIFDGAELPLAKNIDLTHQCVDYARSANPKILIEAELGYIGKSSKLLDEIPEGAGADPLLLTKPEEAATFVEKTGVDLFSPAVGNIHGMLKNIKNPHLNIELVSQISQATGLPLVLHGGSGISDDDFVAAINAGMAIVHINTEIRLAYKQALTKALQDSDEIAPYKYAQPAVEAVQEVVTARLKLFNKIA